MKENEDFYSGLKKGGEQEVIIKKCPHWIPPSGLRTGFIGTRVGISKIFFDDASVLLHCELKK